MQAPSKFASRTSQNLSQPSPDHPPQDSQIKALKLFREGAHKTKSYKYVEFNKIIWKKLNA
ncbi:MAG: hypothetical protein CMH63_03080 [Nanoarchaeota archaeon]|nr:hypothetical protein [Nanoarchaeota archaeon]